MNLTIRPKLQYRWKLHCNAGYAFIIYNGIIFQHSGNSRISIDKEIVPIINAFDGQKTLEKILHQFDGIVKTEKHMDVLKELIESGIIVDSADYKKIAGFENKQTCVRCVNNNYIIPDLEFDKNGLCSFCQRYDKAGIKDNWSDGNEFSDTEIISYLKNNKSRFDALVLYTGGKDSSFLLWYLAKKLKLNVLAATWNMPFAQKSALRNIRSAMKKLPNTDFVERTIRWDEIKKVTRRHFIEFGSPCLCMVIAYHLFYPLAVYENIPLFIDGAEKAQILTFNNLFMDVKENVPAKTNDRDATIAELMMQARAARSLRKNNKEISFLKDLNRLNSIVNDNNSSIPIIKHLGNINLHYTWDKIIDIIKSELNWEMPDNNQKAHLHTSCKIECIKDFCQYRLYKAMRTSRIPQSIIEISNAVYMGDITREQGLQELSERGYYAEPSNLKDLLEILDLGTIDEETEGEIKYVLNKSNTY